MKQFQYTACRTGRSVSGRSGFQVRAASPGLPDPVVAALSSAARYELPPGLPGDTPPTQAPRRLALVALPDGGRAVVHSAHVGPDPETGRMGNFFSHAAAGTAAEVDPLAALRTWGGRFWATADGDGPTALPDAPADRALAPGGVLTDAARQQTVRDHRAVVEFLLTGLLTDAAARLFVLAPPEVVARALDAALSVLPPTARAGVTFSTYEPPGDLLTARPRVVGTWAPAAGAEMDAQCYGGVGLGFNPGTGKKSPLPPAPEFVPFALDALAAGQPARLAAADADLRKHRPADGPGVALLYRLLHGTALPTADELARPEVVALADGIVARDGVAPVLAAAAAAGRLPPAFAAALARAPQVGKLVADDLWARGVKAAREGRAADMHAVWNALAPLDPGFDRGRRLLDTRTDPRGLPFPVRRELLPAVLAAGRGKPADTAPWLAARADELPDLLAAVRDRADKLRAVAGCVRADPTGAKRAAAAVAADPGLALEAGYEVRRAGGDGRAFVAAAVDKNPGADWFGTVRDWFKQTANQDAEFLDGCLTDAIAGQDRLDLADAVAYGPSLRRSFPRGASWVRLARRVLDEVPGWTGRDDLRAFLKDVADNAPAGPPGDDIRKRVKAGVEIDEFCRGPRFDRAMLQAVAGALAALPADDPRSVGRRALAWAAPGLFGRGGSEQKVQTDQVLDAVVGAWLKRQGDAAWRQTRPEFEAAVEHLGPAFPGGPAGLYADLWRRAGRRLFDNGGLLYAVLAVGAGKADAPALRDLFRERQQRAHVRAIAARYAAGREAWDYVDAQAKAIRWGWRPPRDGGSVRSKLWRDIKYYANFGFYAAIALILIVVGVYSYNHKWIDQKYSNWFSVPPKLTPGDETPPAPPVPEGKGKPDGKDDAKAGPDEKKTPKDEKKDGKDGKADGKK